MTRGTQEVKTYFAFQIEGAILKIKGNIPGEPVTPSDFQEFSLSDEEQLTDYMTECILEHMLKKY